MKSSWTYQTALLDVWPLNEKKKRKKEKEKEERVKKWDNKEDHSVKYNYLERSIDKHYTSNFDFFFSSQNSYDNNFTK